MKDRSKTNQTIKYYWDHVRSYPKYLIGVFLAVPITILINSYIPTLILANVLGKLSSHNYTSGHVWSEFGSYILLYIASLAFGLIMWRVVDYFVWRLEANISKAIAEEVLDHMLLESVDFHANNFTGGLVSQTNKLLAGYVRAADTTIFQVYPMLAGIVITALILLHRAPLFVVVFLCVSLMYILIAVKIAKPVRKLSAKHAAAESRQTGYMADAITNVIAIKSFSKNHFERKRFSEATNISRHSLLKLAKVQNKQINYLGTLGRTMTSLALVMAIVSVVLFNANIATVFLIFSYTASIADQLFAFSHNSLRNYNRSIGDASDMVEILSQTPAVIDSANPEKSQIKSGEVVFKDVTFDHESSGEAKSNALFANFNLHISPGEKVGLVGHSGGGKTTLTKLILRFMDIDGGEILIDGQNITHITQDDLRRSITYVPQEPLLFHRTLAENIGYGKAGASKDEITRVAKMAHAHEFINDLPHKYETLVGERGIKLSGGQRQRVAIARAMLKDAPILLLDEATSALDSESEVLIQDALWKLMESKTAIVIAHRLSTIQKMDRIIVLEDGKIVEQGSHKELLAKNGTYARLWAHQSGGFLED
ncbi:ABC transporter ATP-binding protein [Candidatus Saccharibacteria bacterium]|nr:ABC transporter ATP-binding protein [Candidatus Saccharibacteria bacterium]